MLECEPCAEQRFTVERILRSRIEPEEPEQSARRWSCLEKSRRITWAVFPGGCYSVNFSSSNEIDAATPRGVRLGKSVLHFWEGILQRSDSTGTSYLRSRFEWRVSWVSLAESIVLSLWILNLPPRLPLESLLRCQEWLLGVQWRRDYSPWHLSGEDRYDQREEEEKMKRRSSEQRRVYEEPLVPEVTRRSLTSASAIRKASEQEVGGEYTYTHT